MIHKMIFWKIPFLIRGLPATILLIFALACQKEDAWHRGVRSSPMLGWEHVPAVRGIDARGVRGGKVLDVPAKGGERILLIGDSFLDNERLAQIFLDVAKKKKIPGEFLLGGMTGYGPDQYYLWYRIYGHFLRPDVVIVCWFVGNDLADIGRMKNNGGYQKPYFSFDGGKLNVHGYPIARPEQRFAEEEFSPAIQNEWHELVGFKKAMADKRIDSKETRFCLVSRLYRIHYFLYAQAWPYRYLKDSLMNRWTSFSRAKEEEQISLGDLWYLRHRAYSFFTAGKDTEAAWLLNEAILAAMNRDIQKDGGRMVVCLVPHLWQIDPQSSQRFLTMAHQRGYQVDLTAPNRRLRETSRRLHVPFLDLTDTLRQARGRGALYDSTYSAAHWSELGMRVVAATVVQFLGSGGNLVDR